MVSCLLHFLRQLITILVSIRPLCVLVCLLNGSGREAELHSGTRSVKQAQVQGRGTAQCG